MRTALRGAAPRPARIVTSAPASWRPAAEGDWRIEDAKSAHLDALEPRWERRIEEQLLRDEVRPHAEERAQPEEDHAGRPRLRDARDEVVRGPRRIAEVPLEPAEELG